MARKTLTVEQYQRKREYNRGYRLANPQVYRDASKRWYIRNPGPRLLRVRASAKREGHIFSLTTEDFNTIIAAGECFYCQDRLGKGSGGLDRRDNTQGYSRFNCVACCTQCNRFKGNFLTEEEMLAIVEMLQQMRKKTKIWQPS